MKKKIFTLLTLLLCICSGAWAGTETPGQAGLQNTNLIGKSYTIAGDYIAGNGGTKVSPMESYGVKVRLTRNNNTMVISVNDGYRIDGLTIYAVANHDTQTSSVTSITVDGTEKLTSTITIPNRKASTAATINITDAAEESIVLTFSGDATQGVFDFHFTYTQTQVIVQEITAVSLNGSAISDTDLATLKSEKALTIDGSSLNGLGALAVTLSSGGTTPTREISGTSAIYTFTINTSDEYTVTVTNVAKTYTLTGVPVYYQKGVTPAEGTFTNTVKANGITLAMVDTEKTFQPGSGSVLLGADDYTPLKLSTGCAVNVTFPEGLVATKVIVYGWSANGNGAIQSIAETSESTDAIDTSNDIFYATNTYDDCYPSVYEYNLENWESFYFNPGGSASQPFVVLEFVFAPVTMSITSAGWASFSNISEVAIPEGVTAYYASANTASSVTLTEITDGYIPANTGVIIQGAQGNYQATVTATGATLPGTNLLKPWTTAGTPKDETYYTLAAGPTFAQSTGGTLAAGKAYLVLSGTTPALSILFDTTGIQTVERLQDNAQGEIYNLAGQRVVQPTKGLYIVNGKKVVIK